MSDIVVVGGAGFAGRCLVAGLSAQDGVTIRALVHNSIPPEWAGKNGVIPVNGDLLSPETLPALCTPGSTVVNLAYLRGGTREQNLAAVDNLLEACLKAKIKRFIQCSTVSVFGRATGDAVTEASECRPLTEYEKTKLDIEKAVLRKSRDAFEAVILRPSAIFGPGGKNLLKMASELKAGNGVVSYLKSCLYSGRRMNLVSVYNVAAAIEFFIRTEKPVDGEVFIVSDDDSAANNYTSVEEHLRRGFGLGTSPVPPLPAPVPAVKALLFAAGKSNFNPRLVYSPQKLLDFGFKKRVSLEEGLTEFAEWYKAGQGN